MNKQSSIGEYKRDQQLFRRHSEISWLPACREGKELEILRDRARQGAARGLHDALHESGQRQPGERAQQSARGHAAPEGGRLRNQGPQAGRHQGPARQRSRSWLQEPRSTSASRCSTSRRSSGSASASASARSTTCSTESPSQLRFRSHHRVRGPQSLSPGNEQREFFGSQAADLPGSRNIAGIKNPAIDTLIDRIIFAKDRAELVAAMQGARPRAALEFLCGAAVHLSASSATARWDRFSHPDPLPNYGAPAFPPCGGGMPKRRPR